MLPLYNPSAITPQNNTPLGVPFPVDQGPMPSPTPAPSNTQPPSPTSGGIVDFSTVPNPYSSSNSWSGLTGPSRSTLEQTLGDLTGNAMSGWGSALGQAGSMPQQINAWADDRIRTQRLQADDWYNAMSAVANQRASQGIMGGTETQNLQGSVMSQLIGDLTARQDAIRDQANQMRLASTMAMPELWGAQAGMIPQIGSLLREGMTTSYSEDPAAIANIIARLITAGYTG